MCANATHGRPGSGAHGVAGASGALVAGLDESDGFALAGGAGLAAHGLLERPTRDLDYFGPPEAPEGVGRLADAIQQACIAEGLTVQREREADAFVRLTVGDGRDSCEVDIAIDYRALGMVATPHGPTLDLRELGANKVLAIFDRAAPRDFLDLQELTRRFSLPDLIALAAQKDRGLDLDVLDHAMGQVARIPPERLGLDDAGYRALQATVHRWQTSVRQLRATDLAVNREALDPDSGIDFDR